jgi:hypothetical protein
MPGKARRYVKGKKQKQIPRRSPHEDTWKNFLVMTAVSVLLRR